MVEKENIFFKPDIFIVRAFLTPISFPQRRFVSLYLSYALLFDPLHRKDVLSSGRELHSRLNLIESGRGVDVLLATHRRCAVRSVRAVRAW